MEYRTRWSAFRRSLLSAALALCLLAAVAPAQADSMPPPTLAFAVIVDSADSDSLHYLYRKPDEQSEVVIILPVGSSIEIIEDVDEDWACANAAPYEGYVRKENLKLYPVDEIFLEDTAPTYEAGSYTVGTDMPAGLYEFMAPEKAIENLEIALNGAARSYELTGGYGNFAFYLPEGATVTLSGGNFTPMINPGYGFSDHDARYARFGRFITCKTVSAGMLNVELAPGAESGYLTISSLSEEEDLSVELRRVEILPGQKYQEFVSQGMFVEFYNCISPGNG